MAAHTTHAAQPSTPVEYLLSFGRDDKTKTTLKFVILALIAAAAVASRLFSVIRFESIIHEFDPWFNFRATKYLVANGFQQFWDWFDDRTWHPLGRVTGGTLYPGLMVTSGLIYHLLRFLAVPVDIRNICVLLAPACSGLTAYASYLLTNEMAPDRSASAGLLAAVFMGIAPGYISRSVAGSYDNEAIAIFLLVFTFYLWIKALKQGSVLWGALCALFYGYMVASWGGYAFITCLVPLHAFVLVCMGRFSNRLYVSYTTWYALGTLASMQIPFVGFLPVRTSEHMPALGIFGFLQIVAFLEYVRSAVPSRQFQTFLYVGLGGIFGVGILGLVGLTAGGYIAPWSGRFYSLWDTGYAKIHIPIIASVSEHQPTAWPAFFFDLNMLIWLFPAGVYMCFQKLEDEHVFIIVYALFGSYFAGVMVRLMLTLTPVVCVAAAIAASQLLDTYLQYKSPAPTEDKDEESAEATAKKSAKPGALRSTAQPVVGIYTLLSKGFVAGCMSLYLIMFVQHCTWVTSNAYSSPSVVLASRMPDGSQHIIDDYREAYQWLRQNTKEDAKIMSWWDYGYQIGGMADRPTLVDNNTWNNTHIATVGKAMSSREEVSYSIMRQHEVDYVLVVFGGLLGYSGDDINKFLWMVRIAEGIWPDEVKERDFFTARGEYKVDGDATETMKNSLMYKMSYYNYGSLFPPGQATDRVRGVRLPEQGPVLNTLEEAYTSENWIIRIYKVKDLDNVGREHAAAASFERGHKKKKANKKRGPRVLRIE
ncbi:glycosyltransferase family 66 protein [Xylariaceae sp. FL1019]|nr:glycosyltransferase family 66 protein [Xylariaceae sp. FL1019]